MADDILRIDPFAKRSGKCLSFQNINMTVQNPKNGDEIQILQNVSGEVPEHQIVAIMGPSGSGKTSLLNVLAGRARSVGKITVQSDVRLNNYTVDPTNIQFRKNIAFVAQDDSLQQTSTPSEAIRFSAKLRLPRTMTDTELDLLVHRMIKELGLQKCQDTIVGGPLLKGVSGGERKRTSVGVEIVTKPAIVFLDEPTSGLDSYSAMQIVKVLKKVSNAGSSVLFTIHQPSSDVFNSVDNLLLMNAGRVMVSGPIRSIPEYFDTRGYSIPEHYNPADWVMDIAQTVPITDLENDGFFHDVTVLPRPTGSLMNDPNRISSMIKGDIDEQFVSLATQVGMLLKRELLNIVRNKRVLAARFMLTFFMSFLLGIIFYDVGSKSLDKFVNIQSHFGGLVMVLMLGMFGTAQPSLLAFPDERPVFLREYSTNHYSVISYFVCRLILEASVTFVQIWVAVIVTYHLLAVTMNIFLFFAIIYVLAMASTAVAVLLGCSVSDPKMGQEFLPVLFIPQLLFAGFFVPTEYIPQWLRWAQYLCSLTYAVRLALEGEFKDCAEEENQFCEDILTVSNVYQMDIYIYWIILLALFVFFRISALLVLKRKASMFY